MYPYDWIGKVRRVWRALARAKPGDLICAAGSVFVVAEVMEEMGGEGISSLAKMLLKDGVVVGFLTCC